MEQKTIYELFEELTPKEKQFFIEARLAWAGGGALMGEITLRNNPLNDE